MKREGGANLLTFNINMRQTGKTATAKNYYYYGS